MQKIGIVGGAAWHSTLEYYRLICDGAARHFRAQGMSAPLPTPTMTIESLNMAETRSLRGRMGNEDSWADFDAVIRDSLRRLEGAGCDFAIIANNTMHTRLHAITKGVDIPVLSILDAVADAAASAGAGKALVLGTSVTMRADDYSRVLATRGIEANARLDDATIDGLQSMIDTDFYAESISPAARSRFLDLCRGNLDQPESTAVLLACTELPLAFPEHAGEGVFRSDGMMFVHTVAVHVRAVLARSLGTESAAAAQTTRSTT